jgi:serine/threonine-protein kinase HipA
MAIGQTFRLDRIKEHLFKKFAVDMNIQPKLLTSLIKEVCEAVKNKLDSLIAEHNKNYGEAKIYNDLNEIIKSNIIQIYSGVWPRIYSGV